MCEIGFEGEGFAFDNELPRHPEYLRPFALASRLVSCAEYLEFIEDGGYRRPELWLSAGWDTVKAEGWKAPLYWRQQDGAWQVYTLYGELPLTELLQTPVCHVSYFEADAFAQLGRTSGCRRKRSGRLRRRGCRSRGIFWKTECCTRGPGRGPGEGSGADVWGCVGVDRRVAYLGVPRVSRRTRCARRVQREIHVQPDGAARWIGGHASLPYPCHLP